MCVWTTSSALCRAFARGCRLFSFLAILCAAVTLSASARERITIQKSGTNQQLRAADAYLDQGSPANPFGGAGTLQVQSFRNAGINLNQRTLVQFDLSLLPNVGVKIATLTLHLITPPAAAVGTRTYNALMVTSFWNEPDVSWTNRVKATPWGAAGGDVFGSVTSTATVNSASIGSVSWDITQDVQSWYNSTTNYGTLIRDNTENSATAATAIFSSKEDTTPASRPSLTVTYLQNVQNLTTSAAGSGSVTLKWTNPTPITGATVLENYTGVLILRRASQPVDKGSVPTDGNVPALCATVGSGTVIFVDATSATTFTDNAANDTCGAPVNGTTYYYKVFARDTANNWTANGAGLAAPRDGGSTFTAEACGTPNVAGSSFACNWMIGTHTTNLSAPGLIPGTNIALGGGINLVFAVNPTNGQRLYPPVSLGGPINARPPILDSTDSSLGSKVAYIADQDNFIYAIDASTGQILWLVNPNSSTNNTFQGAAAVVVKSFATGAYTLANDLVVVGTHNGTTTTGNSILAVDGNTGASKWSVVGNTGSIPAMDIISSTPAVDYKHNLIWVTSRSNAGNAQPSLWQLNANTGALTFSAKLGDIDSSPSLSAFSDLLVVGNNAGTIYAINPTTGATLNSFAQADGAIRGFPVVSTWVTPFTIVFTTSTLVHAVSFNANTNTFTALWTRAVTSPSAPLVYGNFIYVGSSDGFIHELNLATGVDVKDAPASTGYPAVIGDPTIDTTNNQIFVSTTTNDQRVYAFPIPF